MALTTRNSIQITKYDFDDQTSIPQIENDLNLGKVLFLNTKQFFDKYEDNLIVLKNTFDQIRVYCERKGGQVARVGKNILVLTPNDQIRIF